MTYNKTKCCHTLASLTIVHLYQYAFVHFAIHGQVLNPSILKNNLDHSRHKIPLRLMKLFQATSQYLDVFGFVCGAGGGGGILSLEK